MKRRKRRLSWTSCLMRIKIFVSNLIRKESLSISKFPPIPTNITFWRRQKSHFKLSSSPSATVLLHLIDKNKSFIWKGTMSLKDRGGLGILRTVSETKSCGNRTDSDLKQKLMIKISKMKCEEYSLEIGLTHYTKEKEASPYWLSSVTLKSMRNFCICNNHNLDLMSTKGSCHEKVMKWIWLQLSKDKFKEWSIRRSSS